MIRWFQTYDRLKFETLYAELKLDLKDNDTNFLDKLYEMKKDWAKSYTSTFFNANKSTTTRNESWHSKTKQSLSSFSELSDLVSILLELDGDSIYEYEKPRKVTLFGLNLFN